MAKLLKLRRGTDTQHTTFTGAEGEVTVNTTNDSLHVHDGTTAGGTELAKADLSNVDSSLSNNLGFADNVKARFGTGNDLEIYHDGTNSLIEDVGTSNLIIKTNGSVNVVSGLEFLAQFTPNGAADLYYDNSKKLATTSTGIDVTGTVTCDGITSDGDVTIQSGAGVLNLRDTNSTGDAAVNTINFQQSDGTTQGRVGYITNGTDDLYIYNDRTAEIRFGTANTDRVVIDGNGHLHPHLNNTYDIGTPTNQWRNGYFDGTVNCDGLVTDGNFTLTNGDMTIGSDTDTGVNVRVDFEDNGGVGQFNLNAWGTAEFKVLHNRSGVTNGGIPTSAAGLTSPQTCPIYFANSGTARAYFDTNGHFRPAANNTYDLGSGSEQWRNAYFAGDVTFSNSQRFPTVPMSYQTSNITLSAGHAGTVVDTSGAVNVPASVFSVGQIVTIYNRTSSSINVNQGSGLTMRLVGDGGTGNRTLDAYGMATIWFRSGSDCIISGIGVN